MHITAYTTSNKLEILLVPSHEGIQGSERADELANIGAALETLCPDPVPQLSHSLTKTKNRE